MVRGRGVRLGGPCGGYCWVLGVLWGCKVLLRGHVTLELGLYMYVRGAFPCLHVHMAPTGRTLSLCMMHGRRNNGRQGCKGQGTLVCGVRTVGTAEMRVSWLGR